MMKYHSKARRLISFILSVMLVCTVVISQVQVYAEVTAPAKLEAHHAYSVIDARTGEILLDDSGDEIVYPASTTKLMTAMVVLDNVDKNKVVKIKASVLKNEPAGCSNYGLKAGEKYTVNTLLHMLLICSAGDAATCLAVESCGSWNKFVDKMNDKCEALGLEDTNFDNPMGLDIGNGFKNNYTTANEMAKITRAAMSYKEIKRIVAKKTYRVKQANGKKGRKLTSTNAFYSEIPYSEDLYEIIGSKTGTTKAAGSVFSATAIDEAGHEVICVYMGAKSREATFKDIKRLLDKVYKAQKKGKLALSDGHVEIKTDCDEYNVVLGQIGATSIIASAVDSSSRYEFDEDELVLTYTSSDESVVLVDSEGNVQFIGPGQAEIIIKTVKTAYHSAATHKISVTVSN